MICSYMLPSTSLFTFKVSYIFIYLFVIFDFLQSLLWIRMPSCKMLFRQRTESTGEYYPIIQQRQEKPGPAEVGLQENINPG